MHDDCSLNLAATLGPSLSCYIHRTSSMKVNDAFLALLQAPLAAREVDWLRFRPSFGDIGESYHDKDTSSDPSV